MGAGQLSPFRNLQHDFPAAIVVTLIALPLCLGIALASGAPLFSGIISGVVGGIVVGLFSRSPLSVSGPAAGLTVIVLGAIQQLDNMQAFYLAVLLAGGFQIIFGLIRAGVIGDFIPSSVIKGMLAAIGIILILKQLPHAVGYNAAYFGTWSFDEHVAGITISEIIEALDRGFSTFATFISVTSLILMIGWEKVQKRMTGFAKKIPGPLIAVFYAVGMNALVGKLYPDIAIDGAGLVSVPVAQSVGEFFGLFSFPDFGQISNPDVWTVAITLAIIASVETLLSIEAIDKLDPYRRTTPTNRELFAQGIGNSACGLLGGLPVTSVIVRSSANASNGGRTRASTIMHGFMLFGLVVLIPTLINQIPLAVLATVLIITGYKLTKPGIFVEKYQKGPSYFVPFAITIGAILATDLLIGVLIGLVCALIFIQLYSMRMTMISVENDGKYLVKFRKDLYFMSKPKLKNMLASLPDNSSVLLDMSAIEYIDLDNIDVINDFMISCEQRNISVAFKHGTNGLEQQFLPDSPKQ